MKTILALIFGFIWGIIKVLIVGFILSLIWPDIELQIVVSLIALYAVVKMIYKAFKK